MKRNGQTYLTRNPGNIQSSQTAGERKGLVVDTNDPAGLGRVRVHMYEITGDMKNVDINSLPWSDVDSSGRGEFSPPEQWDLVRVSFESGDMMKPVVKGYWRCNPTGRGRLPNSAQTGTTIRPEVWHRHGLYPEARMLGCDGPGNAIWTEAKLINGQALASVIQQEATGGQQIKIRSYHQAIQPYSPIEKPPDGTSLSEVNVGPCTPIRDGFTAVSDDIAGSIEMNQSNVSRKMLNSTTSFAVDQMNQNDLDITSAVTVHKIRQGDGNFHMSGDTIAMSGPAIMIQSPFILPRRMD